MQADALQNPKAGAVLAKATVRAARALALSNRELSEIIGSSEPSISRMVKGVRELNPRDSEGRLALLFLRVFRSLDTLVGGDEVKARDWFRAPNRHLGAAPATLATTVEGLVRVAEYLDALRGSQ